MPLHTTALVLFSGGQDSTTCLALALSKYERVETIAFDYRQRHHVELEARLQVLAPRMRRVGLSATVDDPEVIKAWMGNHRRVEVVLPSPLQGGVGGGDDQVGTSEPTPPLPTLSSQGGEGSHAIDLVRGPPGAQPIVDMLLSEGRVPWAGHTAKHAMAEVYEVIRNSRIALVFVNTRFQAEFAFQELWRLNEDSLPIALHHGSLAAEQRRKVEAAMARGDLRAVVCTSTLDLGIDWGDVDLVIQPTIGWTSRRARCLSPRTGSRCWSVRRHARPSRRTSWTVIRHGWGRWTYWPSM